MVGIFTDSLCIGTLATVGGDYSACVDIFYGYFYDYQQPMKDQNQLNNHHLYLQNLHL